MKEVPYDMNEVAGRLSARIANLELALAHEQSSGEAYKKRVNELEEELRVAKENAE